jgi:hypothetical protein
MIRIREIDDPELKAKVIAVLSDWRGLNEIPEWFELDDADYVDVLNEIRARESPADPDAWKDDRD